MPNRYTLKALERASGVSVRTIREWIRKKVLAPPVGAGRGAHYNDAHLAAARVIRYRQGSGLPLDVIRARISGRSVAELEGLLPAVLPVDAAARATRSADANETGGFSRVRMLQVVALMDGLMLMVDAQSATRGASPRTSIAAMPANSEDAGKCLVLALT